MNKEVTNYFNIFECGRNLLGRLDITYQRAFMANQKYNVLLDTLVKDNNRKSAPLSNDKIWQAFGKVMGETEA